VDSLVVFRAGFSGKEARTGLALRSCWASAKWLNSELRNMVDTNLNLILHLFCELLSSG
jgi:hypothetical protein